MLLGFTHFFGGQSQKLSKFSDLEIGEYTALIQIAAP